MSHQIVDYGLSTPLRELFIILGTAFVVAMRTEFDGHVRILLQQTDQLIQCSRRLRTQRCLVEIIENIIDQDRSRDRSKRKLQYVFFGFAYRIGSKRFLMIQKSFAGCQQKIVYPGTDHTTERAVSFDVQPLIGTIVTHDINLCSRQFVAVSFVNPAFQRLNYLGIFKRIKMIPAVGVAPIG